MIIILAISLISYLNTDAFGAFGYKKKLKKDKTATTSKLEEKQDLKGWGKSKWGMTEEELLETFKGQATVKEKKESKSDNTYSTIVIKNFEIAGNNFNVTFSMGINDNKLREVVLTETPAIEMHFSKFVQLLTEKYGPPQHSDTITYEHGSPDFTKKATWTFPSTKIELMYSDIRIFGTCLLVRYSDKSIRKEALDKI